MERGQKLVIDGKEYVYDSHYIVDLPNGQRKQVTDFLVKNDRGGHDVVGVECAVPENLKYLDIFALDDECLRGIFVGK